jgi:hypothetical protein
MFSYATAHSVSRTGAAHVTSGRAASTARLSESSSGAVCRCCAERCRGSPESRVGDADAGLELEHERVTDAGADDGLLKAMLAYREEGGNAGFVYCTTYI